jgi:hypothetical protein
MVHLFEYLTGPLINEWIRIKKIACEDVYAHHFLPKH